VIDAGAAFLDQHTGIAAALVISFSTALESQLS